MASNSILKLQVDDKQYEASLKSAQQGLQALMNALRNSGKSFSDLDKNQEQYVRALGNMEATAKNTRGRIGEMSSAFVELSQVEKQLTDQERQSPVGKALTESLNQLKQRTIEAKQELADLDKQLTSQKVPATTGGLFSGIGSKMEGALAVFGGNLMTKAAGAVAQLGSEMADMVKQGVEMAKAGEGVRIAFERLGNGQILEGLREATHGTVTDLELMKAAVKFNDFKLPVEELGTMLAFAQQKAKDTGQSVDYMVDSIVTGLGRKSLMILDNLGLSAAEIKDKMKDTGDMTKAVGAIIREQMAKAGDYVETAADRAAQANVNMQNKMEELGRKFAPVEEASNQLWTSMKIGILDIVGGPLARLLNGLTEAGRLKNALNDINGDGGETRSSRRLRILREYSGSQTGVTKQTVYNRQIERYAAEEEKEWRKVNELTRKRQDILKELRNIDPRKDEKGVQANFLNAQANSLLSQINDAKNHAKAIQLSRQEYEKGAKDIMKPVEANVDTDKAVQNVKTLTAQLKELEKQRREAVKSGNQELVEALTKQISQTKTNLGYLDPNAVKTGKSKQQQAEDKVATALRDYQQTIDKASLELKSGAATEADVKKKQLSAQERLYDAYGDAYALYKDPKYKDAQDKAAEEIVKLGGEVKAATEAQEAARKAARELESAQKKLAEAAAKAVNAELNNDLKGFYQANKAIVANGGRPMQTPIDITYTDSNLQAFIGNLKERIGESEVGSDLYNSLTKQLADATMLGNFISEAVKNGIDVADIDPQKLFSKIFGDGQTAGDFIPDGFWEGLGEQYSNATGKNFDVNTNIGEVKEGKEEDEFKKFNEGIGKLTGGLSQVTGGLKAVGVEIPKEVDQVLGVINGVSQIISGVGTIISIFGTSAITANTTAVGLNTATMVGLIAALEVNTATNFIPFANGGIVHAFAQGGLIGRAAGGLMIPGNSMSGDRLRLPVDGGSGMIGVNSGELILNKSSQNSLAASLLQAESLVDSIRDYRVSLGNAQQGVIAGALEGGGIGNLHLDTVISGEDIRLVLNNNGRRTGRGEYVQTNRR